MPRPTVKPRRILALGALILILFFLSPFIWQAGEASLLAIASAGPKPLGEKMEYLGRQRSGPVFICWTECNVYTYYYATDMEYGEMLRYFPKAQPDTYDEIDELYRNPRKKTGDDVVFNASSHNNDIFWIDYLTPDELPNRKLKTTNKKYTVSLEAKKYKIARRSL